MVTDPIEGKRIVAPNGGDGDRSGRGQQFRRDTRDQRIEIIPRQAQLGRRRPAPVHDRAEGMVLRPILAYQPRCLRAMRTPEASPERVQVFEVA